MGFPENDPPAPSEAGGASSGARCRHFGVCGGCARQDVPYEEQLKTKENELRGLLGPESSGKLEPIVPSPSPWFYRNKMEFAFGFERVPREEGGGEPPARPGVALGLRRRGKFYGVVTLHECFLMCEAVPGILAAVREWAAAHELPPYHLRRHKGFLRYLVLREGKRTRQLTAAVVTAGPENESAFTGMLAELAEKLKALGVTSLLWNVTDRQADLAVGEIKKVVMGEERFQEEMAGVRFDLSFYAFFQPNVALAEKLVERARVLLGGGWPMLVDLYSGVGGLTLTLAGQAARAVGIELEPAAVEDAERSAAAAGLKNCQFVAEDSLTFLRRFSNYSFLSDKWAVVVDPPRAGMHPKMPAQLLRIAPPVIIYVSCNPKRLAEDLRELSRSYDLAEATAYDFFPHTPHVEVLVKLVRR